jgi:hypothetical protein
MHVQYYIQHQGAISVHVRVKVVTVNSAEVSTTGRPWSKHRCRTAKKHALDNEKACCSDACCWGTPFTHPFHPDIPFTTQ